MYLLQVRRFTEWSSFLLDFSLSKHFLLFCWFSGGSHFIWSFSADIQLCLYSYLFMSPFWYIFQLVSHAPAISLTFIIRTYNIHMYYEKNSKNIRTRRYSWFISDEYGLPLQWLATCLKDGSNYIGVENVTWTNLRSLSNHQSKLIVN